MVTHHVANPGLFILSTIPLMLFFGMRHALDVDHITAIDNLVRMHNVSKRAKWVGTGFSIGHSTAIFIELSIIIFVVGAATGGKVDALAFWGGIVGAIALAVIGGLNMISMKKWGRPGTAILAAKVASRTHFLGPIGSASITGLIFGFSFDTATQISALTIVAASSATAGIEIAFTLAVFFMIGMVGVDTLDSIFVRSAFAKIMQSKVFRYMSYALSGVALTIALAETLSTVYNFDIPEWIGPILAVSVIGTALGYAFLTRHRRVATTTTTTAHPHHLPGHHDVPGSIEDGGTKKDTESR